MYDPAVGRFMGVDPMAEKYNSWSPYTYTLNNPVKYIDPDGRETTYADRQGNILFVSDDKLDDRIVVVNNGNKEAFFQRLDQAHSNGTNVYGDSFNKQLRGLGQNYKVDGLEATFQESKNHKAEKIFVEDGKGGFIPGFREVGNYLFINSDGSIEAGTDNFIGKGFYGTNVWYLGTKHKNREIVGTVHSHPNEPDKDYLLSDYGSYLLNRAWDHVGPSNPDNNNSQPPKDNYYNAVVNKVNIYLFRTKQDKRDSPDIVIPKSNFK